MDLNIARKTILIADDAEPNRLLLKKIFGAEYNVEEAKNGQEALEKLRVLEDVAVLILDIMMPVIDGFSVLQAMQKDEGLRTIPTVMITANNEEDIQIRALSCGATDVMAKPFSPQVILHRIKNIMARKESEQLAEQNRAFRRELRLMDTDDKSGLFNKNAFHRHTKAMLQNNPDKKFILMRWDIDNFKVFNDWFGIETGDIYLKKMGDFFREYECKNASLKTYARYDADHFVCCQEAEGFDPEIVTKMINDYMINLKLVDFEYTPRVGLYFITNPSLDVTLMCDRALLALRSIKDSYGKRFAWFDDSMRETLIEQQEIVNEMEFALRDGQFIAYFQPQYNYETGKIIGAEALVRWKHPRKGMMLPNKFIPLFERNGFISKLDEYLWEQVCILLREWKNNGMPLVPISVNVSRRDIYNPHLVGNLLSLLQKYDLNSDLLHLEITESAYTQNAEQLVNTVNSLRSHGLEVHMDDFGSGYSSLNMLQNVPVDILKLDMRFLGGDYKAERSGNILNAVVRMATALGLPVLAEGVETMEQAEFLRSIGCLLMQGYLFSVPMPVDSFEKLLLDTELEPILNKSYTKSLQSAIELLSISAQSSVMFQCLVGGAMIAEYDSDAETIFPMKTNALFLAEVNEGSELPRGQNFCEHFSKTNKEKIVAMLESVKEVGEEADCEIHILPQGLFQEEKWFQYRAKLLLNRIGKLIFNISISNISSTRLAERKQNEIMRCFGNMLDQGEHVFMLLDAKRVISVAFIHVRTAELLGYTKEEFEALYSKSFLLSIHPDDRLAVEETIYSAVKGEKAKQSIAYHHVTAKGGCISVNVTVSSVAECGGMIFFSFDDI